MRTSLRFCSPLYLLLLAVIGFIIPASVSHAQTPTWTYGVMAITNFSLTQNSASVINRTSQTDIAPTCSTFTSPVTPGAFQTGVSGTVALGKPISYSILGGNYYCGSLYPFGWAIWIDLNNDGQFAGVAERVVANSCGSYSNGGTPATGTFTLPCGTVAGSLKMRVMACYYYNYNTAQYCGAQYGFQPDEASGVYWYGEAEDYTLNVAGEMGATFPSDVSPNNILSIGSVYSGTSGGYVNCSLGTGETGYVTYRILGPLPSLNSVYVALNPSNSNDTTVPCTGTGNFNQYFSNARGPYAGAAGAINLSGSVTPGSYMLEASFVKSSGCSSFVRKQFYIPLAWDLSVSKINAPNSNGSPTFYKYPRGIPIPISCKVQNVGQNTVTSFTVKAEIRQGSPTGTTVYSQQLNYNNAVGLATGGEISSDGISGGFPTFTTNTVANYYVIYTVDLNNAQDLQLANNILPRATDAGYSFEVQYDIELAATAIVSPSGSQALSLNRPYKPLVRIQNNGLADISDFPAGMRIYLGNSLVYSDDIAVPDVSRGSSTTASFKYWTPTAVGNYRMCFFVDAQDDAINSNDSICIDLNVIDVLSGTYTIGTANSGDPRNFNTIGDAVNAIYSRGLSGPTIFELTDASYTVGNGATGFPALDFTSRITGVSSVNTITFKPALIRSLTRSSIGIRLISGNGVGILFGQNYFPGNGFAVQNTQQTIQNANPSGYITFDGGDQKSFRFMLDVGNATPAALPHRAVFYLGNGSSNLTIKNCLIENYPQSTASYAADLPKVSYTPPNFNFENDVRVIASGSESYSAGIVSRSRVPSNNGNNSLGLDTLTNNNNKFIGNEIAGFGYGIVDIGAGPLFYNDLAVNGNPRFQRYYNKNNEISKNLIMSVRRAGIYVGYSENEVVSNNRIINVGIGATGLGGSTAGIMIGGAVRTNQYSYNNIGAQVMRNEISNISSDVSATGIIVEQTQNSFVNPAGGTVAFPNVNEAVRVTGNIVYAISRTNQTATAAGIHMLTQRLTTATGLTRTITPQVATYFTRGDSVVNNTIIMDADAITDGASVAALGVQHAQNAVVLNNALAIKGAANAVNTAAGNVFTSFFYEGTQPKNGGLTSNRNAFWAPNGAIARFVETDNTSQILDLGAQGDYTSLGQWKAWTRQDLSSVVGNFPADHVLSATTPAKLRVNISPLPLGSILDRRGERIGAGMLDIDGDPRGLNGSRFTIGADEFVGRLYVNDIEAIEVLTPVSYRSATGMFSDAEYIMTTAPVNVTARMRNNGSASQAGVTIVAEIWQEDPSGQFTSMVSSRTQQVSMGAGESVDIDFGFDRNAAFSPQSYAALGWNSFAPAQFSTMLNNVTPRYRIRIYTTTDEYNVNNLVQKEVRFYIMKSNLKLLATTVGSSIASPSTHNERVGRLNNDSLLAGFSAIGVRTSNSALDLFERSGWEPKAVNYAMYRSMFWAGDTTRLTRLQRDDIRAFIAAGTKNDKHNLVVSSQEILGKHVGLDAINDEGFVRYVLRATRSPQAATPRVAGYDGMNVKGISLAMNITEKVSKTNHAVDGTVMPMPSLMRIYSDAQASGLARTAYSYVTRDAGVTDSIMGVANAALTYNVVFLGVDWRHFATSGSLTGTQRVLRSVIEFIERNNGVVVPVELIGFDAKRAGEQVNVSWETASEKNSSHFDVERSVVSEKGRSEFNVIRTVPAKGTSVSLSEYGITDANVNAAQSYVYRLKMVDLDGRSEYSNEVLVSALENNTTMVVSPNPAVAERPVEVRFSADESGMAVISVVDVNGREVLSNSINTVAGNNVVSLNVPNVATGTYVVVVKQGASVQNFNVQITR